MTNETELKAGDYVYHSSFGVGKIIRPAEREGKPGFELVFRERPNHFMSLDILRRTQRAHPDSLRVFAYERQAEAQRLMQEDPAAIVIRAIGEATAPMERPDIERVVTESGLVKGPEEFKKWWGKALPKLKSSPWLEITYQGSKVFIRRLETPQVKSEVRSQKSEESETGVTSRPTPAPTITASRIQPTPAPAATRTQSGISRVKPAPPALNPRPLTPNPQLEVPVQAQFEALLRAYQQGEISKTELLAKVSEKAEAGIGLEQLEDARIRSDLALLLLEEENLPPTLLRWLRGSFISDLTLAELVLDRLVELRQFEILGKSIEQVTSGIERDGAKLANELDFVRWMGQKEPDLAALAIGNGYPWPPAPLTARIIQLFLALIEMEPPNESSRETRKERLVEVARLLDKRSVERDPATITRLAQALNNNRIKPERVVDAFMLLLGQPDRPLVPRLVKYIELNLASLEDSLLTGVMLQLEVDRSEGTDFGLVHWWVGQAVRLKSLKLARNLFEFLLARLNRAVDENEQLRCLLVLAQLVDLELISQSHAAPLRATLAQLFQHISARRLKTGEENTFLLNELITALIESQARLQQALNQTVMDKESAEEELRSFKH